MKPGIDNLQYVEAEVVDANGKKSIEKVCFCAPRDVKIHKEQKFKGKPHRCVITKEHVKQLTCCPKK